MGFQSQARCQAPGDAPFVQRGPFKYIISISGEMPGPWRPEARALIEEMESNFNLRRDARPLATLSN